MIRDRFTAAVFFRFINANRNYFRFLLIKRGETIPRKGGVGYKQVKPSRLDGDLPKDGNAKCIGLIQALD